VHVPKEIHHTHTHQGKQHTKGQRCRAAAADGENFMHIFQRVAFYDAAGAQ
jgi:hypothetical protein